jgi:hypothetical protein
MNQYLLAFCYLFTTVLLFLAFFIVRAVPARSPLNIDLYRDNTIISLAIYNPAELSYCSNETKETLEYPEENDWNNNWDDHESQNDNAWNHADDWTPGLGNQPQIHTPEWMIGSSLTSALIKSERSQDVSLRRTSGPSTKPNMESLSALLLLNLAFPNSKKNLSKKHRVSGK